MPQESEIPTGHSVQALYLNNQYKARNGYAVDSGVAPSTDTGQLGDTEDTVEVTAGRVWYDQRPIRVDSQSIGIDTPGSNPRKDVVIVTSAGDLEVIEGTPSEIPDDQQGANRFETYNPSPPDLSDQNGVPIVEVWIPGGASEISDSDLNDIRAFESRMMLVDEATVTAETGETPAVDEVIEGVTTRQTQTLDVLVTPEGGSNPSYAFNYDWGRRWDDDDGETDIDLTVTWDDDPGDDVDLDVFVIQMNT